MTLSWRPAKLPKWATEQSLDPEFSRTKSPAEFAKIIGRSIFAQLMSGERLGASTFGRVLAKLASDVGALAAKHGWSHPLEAVVAQGLQKRLAASWQQSITILIRPYQVVQMTKAEGKRARRWPQHCIVSDASKDGGGHMILKWNGISGLWDTQDEAAYIFDDTMMDKHIFHKELRALLIACRVFRENWNQEDVYVVIDNAALAWCLHNGLCHSRLGQQDFNDLMMLGVNYQPILVISEDNPADCHSRGKYGELGMRMKNLSNCIKAHQKGWRWSSIPRKIFEGDAQRRHDVPDPYWEDVEEPDPTLSEQ